jgi:4-aminobutyrate aminotransferase-like enzyme
MHRIPASSHLPEKKKASPKKESSKTLDLLRQYESRNVTYIDPDGSWPVVWKKAQGVHVWDEDGAKYLDLTAAFGVAAAGHANPRVVKSGQRQMKILLHAMGDVHPHALKAQLARELSRITFEHWISFNKDAANKPLIGKTIFCNSGFEAVEAALKTALLATGKPGVIAFEKAYHGLGYGALNVTNRDYFRTPFASQIRKFGHFVPFPQNEFDLVQTESAIRRILRKQPIGAILVEPVQGRGGINIPPPEFLPKLREICNEYGLLLLADEIYTGFGRTGRWFACEHSQTIPDLICLGKALTGGFPLSACVGRSDIMDRAWAPSNGEALHTSTFLGHPVGCAMALAHIAEITNHNLVERSARLGLELLNLLQNLEPGFPGHLEARGLGLMAGLEIRRPNGLPATSLTMKIIKDLLRHGYLLLPEGEHGNIISFTPPLTISLAQLRDCVQCLGRLLAVQSSNSKPQTGVH